ncbi:MAG TPA: hypothetical protein EYP78_06270 [Candidatus Omnitrophica bacterium]|nr:hypothetical protein [Candidatus Omnitrophota bacterium]
MKLIPGRKWLVFSGGGLIFILLYIILFLFPTLNKITYLKRAIPEKEKQTVEMRALSREYLRIKEEVDAYKRSTSTEGKESIFSVLERVANNKGLSQNIYSMKPVSSSLNEGEYEEIDVQVKMRNLTLRNLSRYLYTLENPPYELSIKQLQLRKKKEGKHTYVEVDLIVSSLRRKSQGSTPEN